MGETTEDRRRMGQKPRADHAEPVTLGEGVAMEHLATRSNGIREGRQEAGIEPREHGYGGAV